MEDKKIKFKSWEEIYEVDGGELLALFTTNLFSIWNTNALKLYKKIDDELHLYTFLEYMELYFKEEKSVQRSLFVLHLYVLVGNDENYKSFVSQFATKEINGRDIKVTKSMNAEDLKSILIHLYDRFVEFNNLRNFIIL